MTGLEIAAIAAISVAATAASVAAAQSQASAVAKAAKFNASMQQQEHEAQALRAEREMQIAATQADQEAALWAFDEATERQNLERVLAGQRATIAASGVEFSGSPLLTAIETASQGELALAVGEWESQIRQQNLRSQAQISQFEAGEFRRAGRSALRVGRFNARQARVAGTYQSIAAGLQGASSVGGILLTPRQ